MFSYCNHCVISHYNWTDCYMVTTVLYHWYHCVVVSLLPYGNHCIAPLIPLYHITDTTALYNYCAMITTDTTVSYHWHHCVVSVSCCIATTVPMIPLCWYNKCCSVVSRWAASGHGNRSGGHVKLGVSIGHASGNVS